MREGRSFVCLERGSFDAEICQVGQRYLSQALYAKSQPWIAPGQDTMLMPRFATSGYHEHREDDEVIDVYENPFDAEFWSNSAADLDTSDSHFKCTLELKSNDCHAFQSIVFSSDSRYAGVLCRTKLSIYSIASAATQMVTPALTVEIGEEMRATYDRILGAYLVSSDLEQSWLILASSEYQHVHLLRILDFETSARHYRSRKRGSRRSLGGLFAKASAGQQILFRIKADRA